MTIFGDGLSVGCAVEVNGELGQLVDWSPIDERCRVALLYGETVEVLPEVVKPAANPGCDILVGPRLQLNFLAEEVSQCLFAKGYCVLKICQAASDVEASVATMKDMHDGEELKRLPTEVEEGYLGFNGRGKVTWLEEGDLSVDPTIRRNDLFLTSLAHSLLPYSPDVLGDVADQRTQALLSMWLRDDEIAEYPSPFPDDKVLGTYLNTFDRALLKAVHFMGPSPIMVKLTEKDAQNALPCPAEDVRIKGEANTILLYKPQCLDMSVSADNDKDALSISVTFMKAEQKPMVVGRWDTAASLNVGEIGAPSGTLEKCCVHNLSSRMAANWDDPEFYNAGLTGGCDSMVEFQKSRFDYEEYYCDDVAIAKPWNICMKHTAFVEGLDTFDNKYFSISVNEARTMDPMQRHLLETGAMNLYQMGITKKFADRNPHHGGCSVGLDKDDWTVMEASGMTGDDRGASPNVQAIISNRFSFVFNLKGINYVADTACSASLVATHMATSMMRDRTNDKLEFFICTGIHQCLNAMLYMGAHLGHMFSILGRCTTFNQSADGYVRGDGCSGMALKWGSETDERMALWRGSAAGQNGRSATLTAPNGLAQEDVIWKAIRDASILPPESSCWSCHGTGTSLGDPIEIGSLRKVQSKHQRDQSLAVNTNKTNVGHLEGGAAMTSLLAVVLQLKHGKVNPICHFNVMNPHMEGTTFDGWFNNELGTMNLSQTHAHVSSFGFGGTNGHAVLHGENQYLTADPRKMFMRRLNVMSPPEVRPIGKDPSSWETDGLERSAKPGDIYAVTITKDDGASQPIKYVLEQEGLGEDYDPNDTSYSVIGNFNGEEPMVMEDGDVPGLRSIIIEVPPSGEIEFNFIQTLEPEKVLAPITNRCRRRTAKISGPAEDLSNTWLIVGEQGTDMRIDLFTCRGMIGINWLPAEL
jgi:polyketide synthase-associated protein